MLQKELSLKKLPIGVADFDHIRDEKHNYAYVDKTHLIVHLIQAYPAVFLSRPRRFGKSLLLQTIKALFEGRRELFKGLAADDLYDWSQKYPVIYLDMAECEGDSKEKTIQNLLFHLNTVAKNHQIQLPDVNVGAQFTALIQKTVHQYNQKVIILIDEYDLPLIKHITHADLFSEVRDTLASFYKSIKSNSRYIQFAMLTGVSRIAHASVFSGLNNLKDISFDRKFAAICGYTQEELESTFRDHLQDVDLQKVKNWYDGYSFDGSINVYNPFDILLFLDAKIQNGQCMYDAYWCRTGMPGFLYKLLQQRPRFLSNMDNSIVERSALDILEAHTIDTCALSFQTGYLTIKEMILPPEGGVQYRLGYPNDEVRRYFLKGFFDRWFTREQNQKQRNDLRTVLEQRQLDQLFQTFESFFSSIPYEISQPGKLTHYEGYYTSLLVAWCRSIFELHVTVEESTNLGRIDMVVSNAHTHYILEIKMDTDAQNALQQIKTKKYAQKYINHGNPPSNPPSNLQSSMRIYLIGVAFNEEKRNIVDLVWEEYKAT